jgi:hypothetical protein
MESVNFNYFLALKIVLLLLLCFTVGAFGYIIQRPPRTKAARFRVLGTLVKSAIWTFCIWVGLYLLSPLHEAAGTILTGCAFALVGGAYPALCSTAAGKSIAGILKILNPLNYIKTSASAERKKDNTP